MSIRKSNGIFFAVLILISTTSIGIFVVFFVWINPSALNLIKRLPQYLNKQIETKNISYTRLSHISEYILQAAIVSQDRRFYSNIGIDIQGTIRAVVFTILNHQRQGASTITEQLAKNLYFNDQDSLRTDIATKILALYLTYNYPKEKILEMYLNIIYFGDHAYGIYQASIIYFHVGPNQLTPAQAAYLIGLINKPSYLSTHTLEAMEEAKTILQEMEQQHYLSQNQFTQSLQSLNNMSKQ